MKTKRISIGEYYASQNEIIIETLVGSCVAVCLYDPVNKIGGMNHIFLPGEANLKRYDTPARFGINAMELLINKMMNLGAARKQMVAKAFGGAHLFPSISPESGIGKKNVDFVLSFLENESLRLVSHDLGGYEGRKLFFHTDTGDVYLKRIRSSQNREFIAVQEEKQIEKAKREIGKTKRITWF